MMKHLIRFVLGTVDGAWITRHKLQALQDWTDQNTPSALFDKHLSNTDWTITAGFSRITVAFEERSAEAALFKLRWLNDFHKPTSGDAAFYYCPYIPLTMHTVASPPTPLPTLSTVKNPVVKVRLV